MAAIPQVTPAPIPLGQIANLFTTWVTTAMVPTNLLNMKTIWGMAMGTLMTLAIIVIVKGMAPIVTSIGMFKDMVETKADEMIGLQKNKNGQTKIKPKEPEMFDGSPEKVMGFLTSLMLYFMVIGEEDETRRILYGLSLVRGGKRLDHIKLVGCKNA